MKVFFGDGLISNIVNDDCDNNFKLRPTDGMYRRYFHNGNFLEFGH